MISAVLVYSDWVNFALYLKENLLFSVHIGILLKYFAALLFQWQETKKKLVWTWCYQTMNLNQLIGHENEEANQSGIVQYVHEVIFKKDLIESSVEYAVAFEKLLHMVKYADAIRVEYCEHKQKKVTELNIFQGCLVETISDGFQDFCFYCYKSICPGSIWRSWRTMNFKQSAAIFHFRIKLFNSTIFNQLLRRTKFWNPVVK